MIMTHNKIEVIRIALPSKGQLHEGAVELLRSSGYKIRRGNDRQYEASISGRPRFRIIFMRPTDIVAQVHEGRCVLGVTGYDVYAERAAESCDAAVVSADLGYGACRLVVAVPESWVDVAHILDLADLAAEFKAGGRAFRVATKYPALTRSYFRQYGIYHYRIIESEGALEPQPSLGIADVIVDLTSSGVTLKENRLREIKAGTVLESAACLIGHAPSLRSLVAEGDEGELAILLDAIDGVRGSEDMRHLEVVGGPAEGVDRFDPKTPEAVASYLIEAGARHVCRGDVWDDHGRPAWRVTALIPEGRIAACRGPLFRLGAGRIVGLAARFVYDRDTESTFNQLKQTLEKKQSESITN